MRRHPHRQLFELLGVPDRLPTFGRTYHLLADLLRWRRRFGALDADHAGLFRPDARANRGRLFPTHGAATIDHAGLCRLCRRHAHFLHGLLNFIKLSRTHSVFRVSLNYDQLA